MDAARLRHELTWAGDDDTKLLRVIAQAQLAILERVEELTDDEPADRDRRRGVRLQLRVRLD